MDKRTSGVLGLVFLAAFFLLLPALGEAQVNIICGGAVTIAGNLSKVPSGGTLFVKGTCTENLTIAETRTNFTIDGQGSAKLVAKDPTKAAVTFRGHRVTVKGLDISNGNVGIDVRQGGIATISANKIHNNGTGIRVRDVSNASIDSNLITTNGGDGIRVGTESGATISSNSITTNPGRGVRVEFASHAAIDGNDISSNGSEGVEVADTAKATIGTSTGNTISSNSGSGVRVRRGSSASIVSNDISDNIFGRGIRVEVLSHADIANNSITNNGTDPATAALGVEVTEGSSAVLGGTGICRPGQADGPVCNGGAGGANAANTGNTITGNGDGVRVRRNSYMRAISNDVSFNGLNSDTTHPLAASGTGFTVDTAGTLDLQNNLINGNMQNAVSVATNAALSLSGTASLCAASLTSKGFACTTGDLVTSDGLLAIAPNLPNETTGGYNIVGGGCLAGANCNGQSAGPGAGVAQGKGSGGAGLICKTGGAMSGVVSVGPSPIAGAGAGAFPGRLTALAGNVENATATGLDTSATYFTAAGNKDGPPDATCIDKTK